MRQWLWLSAVMTVLGLQALAGQPPAPSIWTGVYTPEQAERGKELYTRHCGSCHGDVLEGMTITRAANGPSQWAPGLATNEFLLNWRGMTAAELLFRMRVSMPQERPGSLSRQQNADILAYLLRENGFRYGSRELPGDDSALAGIRFTW